MKKKHKKLKDRVLALVSAGAAAVSLLLGSSFDSPAQLLEDNKLSVSPPAIVQVMEPELGEDDGGDAMLPGEEKRRSLRARVRQALLALPMPLRICLGIPLWLLGWLLLTALSALWAGVASPLGETVLNAAATSAVLGSAALGAVKAAFPDLPVKKIVDGRSLLRLFTGSLCYAGLTTAMGIIWPDGPWLCNLAEGVALLGVLLWAALPILRREGRLHELRSPKETERISIKEKELKNAKT